MSSGDGLDHYSLSACSAALPILSEGVRKLGFTLTQDQELQFSTYCHFLLTSNARVNLTAVRTPEGVMKSLFLDSLTLSIPIDGSLRLPSSTTTQLLDVGSGAGIPGMALKILYPAWKVALVESIGKKARFLEQLVETLGFEGVTVVGERAETIAGQREFRDRASVCTARAVAPLASLIELCAPFTRTDGLLLFPKSGDITAEIDAGKPAAHRLKVRLESIIPIPDGFGLGNNRSIVMYRKMQATPGEFPRRIGLARSSPIGDARIKRGRQFVKEQNSKN